MTDKLGECRQAARIVAEKHAEMNGYVLGETTESQRSDGTYDFTWRDGSGTKIGTCYRADGSFGHHAIPKNADDPNDPRT